MKMEPIMSSETSAIGAQTPGNLHRHLPMKIEPIVSSETSAIRTQTLGNYPKRNKLHISYVFGGKLFLFRPRQAVGATGGWISQYF